MKKERCMNMIKEIAYTIVGYWLGRWTWVMGQKYLKYQDKKTRKKKIAKYQRDAKVIQEALRRKR